MTSPTATITGRVVGPDGLGRLGRITFTPASLGAPLPARDIVAGRASFRIDTDGYLVGQTGRTATISPGNYEIDLNIPGDLGAHVRTTRTLADGETFNIADLLTAVPAPTPPGPAPQPPQPQPQLPNPPQPPSPSPDPDARGVRNAGQPGILEAINRSEVIDLGNGVLTWR
uniref:Actin-like protein n=1 Tax=Siphoviridae sp. ctuka10 TaxID=2825716 RepID=A0A8S5PC63_9CAUD|nr:MAG TPA: actin-like protein [Siphoviridae sp. ctuka10]